MSALFKKFFFILILNTALLLMLIVGIQNSEDRKKVNLLIGESANLPISFIIGISFISGSLSGGILTNIINLKKESH